TSQNQRRADYAARRSATRGASRPHHRREREQETRFRGCRGSEFTFGKSEEGARVRDSDRGRAGFLADDRSRCRVNVRRTRKSTQPPHPRVKSPSEDRMSWTGAYWDLLERLYWSPQYLGLKSIPQDQWTVDGDTVSIPKDLTNKNGPLYRRIRSGDEYWTY